MGTNFYFIGYKSDDGEILLDTHIGKRSAAGPYCWDCRTTLCKGGNKGVHYYEPWYDNCPGCGKPRINETFDNSTAGRELGFNKSKPVLKTGIASCCSFGWGIPPENVALFLFRNNFSRCKKIIEDEYGSKYTYEEFMDVLKECPIRFYDMIGKEFS